MGWVRVAMATTTTTIVVEPGQAWPVGFCFCSRPDIILPLVFNTSASHRISNIAIVPPLSPFFFFLLLSLCRYSLRWEPNPMDRWNKYFADEVKVAPWIKPRPEGYALMIGQIPTDTAVMGARLRYGSIDAAYK